MGFRHSIKVYIHLNKVIIFQLSVFTAMQIKLRIKRQLFFLFTALSYPTKLSYKPSLFHLHVTEKCEDLLRMQLQ